MDITPHQLARLAQRLHALRTQHCALEAAIAALAANSTDDLESKRLQRHKVQLHEEITQLESLLIPDEPA